MYATFFEFFLSLLINSFHLKDGIKKVKNHDDDSSDDSNFQFIFKRSTPKKSLISSTGFKESNESKSISNISITPPKIDDIKETSLQNTLTQEKEPLDNCETIPVEWIIRSSVNIISPNDISNRDDEIKLSKSMSQFLYYYTYPSEPISAALVHQFRKFTQHKDELSLQNYWKDIRNSWCECINSLKELIRDNEVPFFYILYKSFSVLSLYKNDDDSNSLLTIVNNSTDKFRKKLSSKNVTYEMPYYDPDKHKNLSYIDEQIPSLLIIKGTNNFNLFMDILIEEVTEDDQTVIYNLPTIVSSHPFINSCKKKNSFNFGKIRKLNASNEYEQGFYLEINGFILPNDTINIVDQLKLNFDSFEVKFENVEQTMWLNALNSILTRPYIQHVKPSLLETCIDDFKEIKKITYPSSINSKKYKIKTIKR